jgi:arsenical-resistance protein 2
MASSQGETPWYAAYPAARTQSPASISRGELLELFRNGKEPGRDFVLIDVRRTDFEVNYTDAFHLHVSQATQGGTISGSINLPAQSLYPTIPALYALFKSAGVSKAIWYCGTDFALLPVRAAAYFTWDRRGVGATVQQGGSQTSWKIEEMRKCKA